MSSFSFYKKDLCFDQNLLCFVSIYPPRSFWCWCHIIKQIFHAFFCLIIVTRRIIWKHGPSQGNLCYVEIYWAAQNTVDDFKKTLLSLKGIAKQFASDFVLIWMKQRLIWFNWQRDRTRNGLNNIKEILAGNLQLQMSVLHQRMGIFQGWSLKFIWWLDKM